MKKEKKAFLAGAGRESRPCMALGSVHCRELCLTLTAAAAELGWLGGD